MDRRLTLLGLAGVIAACAPQTPPAATKPAPSAASSSAPLEARSKQIPEPPRPTLRTGALKPVVHPSPLVLAPVARGEDGGFEIIQLKLPAFTTVLPRPKDWFQDDVESLWIDVEVNLASEPRAFAFVETHEDVQARVNAYNEAYRKRVAKVKPGQRQEPYQPPSTTAAYSLWVRRPVSAAPVSGSIYSPHSGDQPGRQVPFVTGPGKAVTSAALVKQWASAAARHFSRSSDSFYSFAERRIEERYHGPKKLPGPQPGQPNFWSGSASDIARLMDTVSGRLSVQRALQSQRSLYLATMKRARSVAFKDVAAPQLAHHEWDAMLKALAVAPPEEPLAKAAPAEFYYVRSRDVPKLLDLGDEVEAWGQPAADFIDSQSQDRGTFTRYEIELGLKRTGLARVLGPAVVHEVALVGSDPYIHEGSDLTLIFRPKNAALLDAALNAMLLGRTIEHGGNDSSSFQHEGVNVQVDRSKDGRVHRYRASAGGLELVSNSENALRVVVSTILGKHGSLGAEADFRYMLARDSTVPADILGYMSDRFIASVIGPAQKIGEARRQLALSELQVPGFAALLAGWVDGKSPANTEELLKNRYLEKAELKHVDGSPIEFTPGSAPRSRWGSPEALTPLIDLPPIDRVSDVEQDAYRQFAASYESIWSDRIDPVAVRLTVNPAGDRARTVGAEMRVLPLLRREYADVTRMVGQARVTPPALGSGLRAVFGIGKDAGLRQHLEQLGPRLLGNRRLMFDWLGDFVVLGLADRNEVLALLKAFNRRDLEVPGEEDERYRFREEQLTNFPAYAVVGIRSQAAATLALATLRQNMNDAAPGSGRWGQFASHRGTAIVQVKLSDVGGEGFAIYYAVTPKAIVASLNPNVLESTIDQILDHPNWVPAAKSAEARRAGQLVIDVSAKKGTAFSTALAWLLATSDFEQRDARPRAQLIFRGAPEIAGDAERVANLMRAYLGTVVLTRDGRRFTPGPDGPRDPVRGSEHAPIWPELPVPGSPVDRLLSRLLSLRSELSFDDEPATNANPNQQSLRARLEVTLAR